MARIRRRSRSGQADRPMPAARDALSILAMAALIAAAGAAIAAGGAVAASTAPAAAPHPFSVHDMLAMERLSEPQVSPDGQWVAFTVRTTDLAANKGRFDLWLVRADGTGLRRLTTHPDRDASPCWGPAGEIYFLSTRSGSSQVWAIDPAGGEPRQVTDLPLDVGNLKVAPQAGALVFSLEVYPGLSPAQTAARDAELARRPASGRAYDELMFRHWDTWEDGKRSHLFVRPLAGGDEQARDLMPDLDADAPTLPFGGAEEFAVSPDGRWLVYAAKVLPGSEPAWSTDVDLWAVPLDGSAPARCLTEANRAVDTQPAFSPDGKTLAYLAMARPGYEADRQRIVLLDWATGAARPLTEAWDRSPGEIAWAHDGRAIWCTADNLGQSSIFRVDAKTGQVAEVAHEGTNHALQPVKNGVLFLRNSLLGPDELHFVQSDGKNLRRLTAFNAAHLAAAKLGEPEQFSFPGWNGETVHGYLVKPIDFDPTRKYPVAFLIHGGPQGSFGNDFHYRWNPQAFVGAGFAALMVDFHGSTGYGQAFTDAINGHWHDRPAEDMMKGLDWALQRWPWLDGGRVVAAGASYGGYAINWLAGQTDRFKALVCHDGNLDERFAYFDTEELWFPEWEHGGTPWGNPDGYAHGNPIDYVQNWRTPTLVIHGELDYRLPYTQGLSTFTALRRQGVPARLLVFPDENHWVLKPQNSIQWHDEVLGWLKRWTQ